MRFRQQRQSHAFTLLEVMVSAALVAVGMGSVLSMSAQSIQTLRATRQMAAASQVGQQRIEDLRGRLWPEMSSVTALEKVMRMPTASEAEVGDPRLIEYLTVSALNTATGASQVRAAAIRLRREEDKVYVESGGDFGAEPTLLVESVVVWRGRAGVQRRSMRAVISRVGLTRSGVFGSAVGRPGTAPGIAR